MLRYLQKIITQYSKSIINRRPISRLLFRRQYNAQTLHQIVTQDVRSSRKPRLVSQCCQYNADIIQHQHHGIFPKTIQAPANGIFRVPEEFSFSHPLMNSYSSSILTMAFGMASKCTGFLKRSLDMRQTLSASSNLWTYIFLLLFILIINRTNITLTFRALLLSSKFSNNALTISYRILIIHGV